MECACILQGLAHVALAAILAAGLVLVALPVPAALTQSPADGFDPGASNYVYALAVQPDDRDLVGGLCTTPGGKARTDIGV